MRAPVKFTLVAALTACLTVAAVLTATATGQREARVIRLTVPISAVRAHETDIAPKGESPGDSFQESYSPARPGQVIRQDAIAIGTFDRGVFLCTIAQARRDRVRREHPRPAQHQLRDPRRHR